MMVSIGHVREVMERLLDTIASSLATMVAEADQATENKTALLNLSTKSRDILEPQLEAIRSKLKAAKIDHVLPALTFLDTCLRDVLALILKRGKKRDAVQLPVDALMVKSSKVRAEIASAENNLFQALLFIMTALQIRSTQILEHQERKAAEDSVKTLHTGEPPWKLNSNATVTKSSPFKVPRMATRASFSPVLFWAAVNRSRYLRLSLNLSRSTGSRSAKSSCRPSASRKISNRRRAPTRM